MLHDESPERTAAEAGWAPVGWFMLVVIAAAMEWSLCLPVRPPGLPSVHEAGSAFRVEWFLTGTALAVFVWHAARSSWLGGTASVLITSTQVLSIADEGAHRLQQAGVVTAVTDLLYLAAFLQVVIFVCVGAAGIRGNLADRRWAKLTRRLTAVDMPTTRQGSTPVDRLRGGPRADG